MKKWLTIFIVLSLVGCQTITIETKPKDSKVYVDGEYLGEGNAEYDAGLRYNIPQSHTIQITHKDHENFQTTIRNKLDVGVATAYALITAGLGLLNVILWSTAPEPKPIGDTPLYIGIGLIAISPIYYLITYRFKDSYFFDLTE